MTDDTPRTVERGAIEQYDGSLCIRTFALINGSAPPEILAVGVEFPDRTAIAEYTNGETPVGPEVDKVGVFLPDGASELRESYEDEPDKRVVWIDG